METNLGAERNTNISVHIQITSQQPQIGGKIDVSLIFSSVITMS